MRTKVLLWLLEPSIVTSYLLYVLVQEQQSKRHFTCVFLAHIDHFQYQWRNIWSNIIKKNNFHGSAYNYKSWIQLLVDSLIFQLESHAGKKFSENCNLIHKIEIMGMRVCMFADSSRTDKPIYIKFCMLMPLERGRDFIKVKTPKR
jgi:hypothetical protein